MMYKTEVPFKNVAELFTLLVTGHVLRNDDWDVEIKIVDGILLLDGKPSSLDTTVVSFWGDMDKDGYRLYKETPWYENIPKDGVIC